VGQILDLYQGLFKDVTLQVISPTMEDRVAWFLPPLSGVMEAVTEAARARPGVQITLVDMPSCIAARFGEALPNISHRRERDDSLYPAVCNGCDRRGDCSGFSEAYLELYGTDEVEADEALQSPLSLQQLRWRCTRYILAHQPQRSNEQGGSKLGTYPAASHKLHAILGEILLEQQEEDAPGLFITGVLLEHHERITVKAAYKGERIQVLVSWRDKTEKTLISVGPFALMTPREEPIDTANKKRAVNLLARILLRGWKKGPA